MFRCIGAQRQSISRFHVLQRATNGFNEANVVGNGGSAKVYMGVLEDGSQIAVKRWNRARGMAMQGAQQLQVEREVLSRLSHPNLVSLLGSCDEQGELILVYEYMSQGALTSHLYGAGNPPLSWSQRLQICVAVAKPLHYLHTLGIIHRDVKPDNILIDENMCAKLGDLGLAMTGPPQPNQDYVVAGTFGYMDPKYAQTGQLTFKSDVYSFGVLSLVVLSGRPVYDDSLPEERRSLVLWGKEMLVQGEVAQVADETILDTNRDILQLHRFSYIILNCMAEEPEMRPTMEEVLVLLQGELDRC